MKRSIYLLTILLFFTKSPLLKGETGDPFSQTKFIPALSFIMDVSYLGRNLNGMETGGFEIPGFIHPGHTGGHSHTGSLLSGSEGFNFNYGELSLFSTVDPYFDLFAAFHLAEDHFEVEEAYVNTRKLPGGFGLRIGKFLSSFGRANSQHAHTWNFQEIPLIYRVFFGDEGLNEKGVQLNWIAPLPFYLNIGMELLQGENPVSFGLENPELHPDEEDGADHHEDHELDHAAAPGLLMFLVKTSADIGDLVILGGISYANGSTRSVHEYIEGEYAVSGRTGIFGCDITLKYLLDSYRYISLQAEYMNRHFSGDLYEESVLPFERSQSGFYTEIIYRFSKLWRTAFRFDMLDRNRLEINGNDTKLPEDMTRYSFMIDYSPTEFSRIRVQYNYNKYWFFEGEMKNFGELNLQLNIAVGAHGAHPF